MKSIIDSIDICKAPGYIMNGLDKLYEGMRLTFNEKQHYWTILKVDGNRVTARLSLVNNTAETTHTFGTETSWRLAKVL
jgi:hypothetical protein